MARPMKNSGIDWIGEIPADWKIGKVSYFFDIQLGKMLQPEPNDKTDTLENYLCAANLGGNKLKLDTLRKMWFSTTDKAKFDVRKGDLLVVEGGDVASCDIIIEDIHDVYIQNAIHRVRNISGFDLRLLRYLLIIAKAQGYIDLICNKATIAHFTKEKFASIPFPVMPLDEQQRIATFLDGECARIDSVIEKTRASVDEYKKLKQAVITRAVTKGIRHARTFKDSGIDWLGEIPTDWDVANIRKLFSFGKGLPITKENLRESGLSVISYGQIHSKFNDGTTVKPELIRFVDDYYLQSNPESIVKKNDFIFADTSEDLTGCGNCVYIDTDDLIFAGYHTIILRNKTDSELKYFAFLFQSDAWRKQIRERVTGVKLFSISQKILRATSILIPPLDEQKEIAAYLDEKTAAIDLLIAKKNQLVTELASLKKSLIFEYVTGKKAVQL